MRVKSNEKESSVDPPPSAPYNPAHDQQIGGDVNSAMHQAGAAAE